MHLSIACPKHPRTRGPRDAATPGSAEDLRHVPDQAGGSAHDQVEGSAHGHPPGQTLSPALSPMAPLLHSNHPTLAPHGTPLLHSNHPTLSPPGTPLLHSNHPPLSPYGTPLLHS